MTTSKVSNLINTAEKLVAEKRYASALEQLAIARKLDPKNKYVLAVLERTQVLKKMADQAGGEFPSRSSEQDIDSGRYLSLTVNREYEGNIKGIPYEPPLSRPDMQARVKKLTSEAEALLSNGSVEDAFNTLMTAYLLDPLSADVMVCEKKVLPQWQQRGSNHPAVESTLHRGVGSHELPGTNAPSTLGPPATKAKIARAREQSEQEKEQKEISREEWKQGVTSSVFARETSPLEPTVKKGESRSGDSGFFSKLKRGKLFE